MHEGYFQHPAPRAEGCVAQRLDWLCGIVITSKYSDDLKATKESGLDVGYVIFENVSYHLTTNRTGRLLHLTNS